LKANDEFSDYKLVYFVRHGQSYHNLAQKHFGYENWDKNVSKSLEWLDPMLSEQGIEDALKVNRQFKSQIKAGMKIDRLITSPLTRTLMTTVKVFVNHMFLQRVLNLLNDSHDLMFLISILLYLK
jgi:broad specificity phosphatase PhoE